MKYLLPILFLTISCSSTSKSDAGRKNASDERLELSENAKWVDQLNFSKKPEMRYLVDKDAFAFSEEEKNHILVRESLGAIPGEKIESSLSKSDDPLIQISLKCYRGKFEEAFKIIDERYDQYKNNAAYWNQVGVCYMYKGEYATATIFFNKSSDSNSRYVPVWNNTGVNYARQGFFQKALVAYKKAEEKNKFSITPVYNKAMLYLRFGLANKALSILMGLQKRSPKDAEVLSALASAYVLDGNPNEAINIYSSIEKNELSKPEIGLNYVVALKQTNKVNEAQNAFKIIAMPSRNELKDYYNKVEQFLRN